MKFIKKLKNFASSSGGTFLIGAMIGAIFFGAFFSFAFVNPTYIDWIFSRVAHGTGQNFIGWEFLRADATGAIANGLAYPIGLPITFMDGIPLIALPLLLVVDILPASFQYFGLWALICYILHGGIAAILVRKVWQKVFDSSTKKSAEESAQEDNGATTKFGWQTLFIIAGTLIFVISPIMIARSLYHPALAAQWLILLGIWLIWEAVKFAKPWKFVATWSILLVGAALIHPYFVPMLGAMMLVAILRNATKFNLKSITSMLTQIIIPIVLVGVVFWSIGGFALGSGAEVRDLQDKGFNLLSFAISNGYSVLPSIPQRSYSPETIMWLGLGLWTMVIFVLVGVFGKYKIAFKNLRKNIAENKIRNALIFIVCFGLFVFAVSPRVDLSGVTLFHYPVPERIYEIWSAFRAAARMVWPFYYAIFLMIIYGFAKIFSRTNKRKALPGMVVVFCVLSIIQFSDVWFSRTATSRREGFEEARNLSGREAPELDLSGIVTTQQHMVVLDRFFRGDRMGFYEMAPAALRHNLTINIGFFARVPEEVFEIQRAWYEKVVRGEVSDEDFYNNIFVTSNDHLIRRISRFDYNIEKRGKFYFITKGGE